MWTCLHLRHGVSLKRFNQYFYCIAVYENKENCIALIYTITYLISKLNIKDVGWIKIINKVSKDNWKSTGEHCRSKLIMSFGNGFVSKISK